MSTTIIITPDIQTKLAQKHNVTDKEVSECFVNRCGINLIDDREDHRTDPPTLWFIAETNKGRLLKIVYIVLNGNIVLKTAYEPNKTEIAIYEEKGK